MNPDDSQASLVGPEFECPDIGMLSAFLEGILSLSDDTMVGQHIETCEKCMGSIEDLDTAGWHRLIEVECEVQQLDPVFPNIAGFKIEKRVGQGGQGVVYRAFEHGIDRWVAIKMIRGGGWEEGRKAEDLLREAKAIGRINHEHIVKVLSVQTAGDTPALVMEWMDGGTLSDRLKDKQPIENDEVVDLLIAISSALACAHANGILHRDIKPSNILFADTTYQKPRLNDFGLAKIQTESGEWSTTRDMIGTPHYMSCEAISRDYGIVGTHSDIYSIGAVLYHLLTGRAPFEGDTPMESVFNALHHDLIVPSVFKSKIPRDLETICLKCMDKNPLRRYKSATELRDDLIRFKEHRPIHACRPAQWQKLVSLARRYPSQSILMLLVVMTTAFSLIFMSVQYQKESRLNNRLTEQVEALALKNEEVKSLNRSLENAIIEKNSHYQEAQQRLTETRKAVAQLTPLVKRVYGELAVDQGELRELDSISDLLGRVGFLSEDVVEEVDSIVSILELSDVMKQLKYYERSEKLVQLALENLERIFRHRGDELDAVDYYNYTQLNIARCYTGLYHLEVARGSDKPLFHKKMAYYLNQSIKNTEGVILRLPKSVESYGLNAAMKLELARWRWYEGDLNSANQLMQEASEQHWDLINRNPDNKYRYLFLAIMMQHEFLFNAMATKNDDRIIRNEQRFDELVNETKIKYPGEWRLLVSELIHSRPLIYRLFASRGEFQRSGDFIIRHLELLEMTESMQGNKRNVLLSRFHLLMEHASCLKLSNDLESFEVTMQVLNKTVDELSLTNQPMTVSDSLAILKYYAFCPDLSRRNTQNIALILDRLQKNEIPLQTFDWIYRLRVQENFDLDAFENELQMLDQNFETLINKNPISFPIRLAYIEFLLYQNQFDRLEKQMRQCEIMAKEFPIIDTTYRYEYYRIRDLLGY